MSVYFEIGGGAAVAAAVDIFYRKVLADDRISHFFDTVDMEAQHAKQTAFLTMVCGGPHEYTGKDMRAAHRHMNLTEAHFDAVAEQLIATLHELCIEQRHIDTIMASVAASKDDILNRESVAS